PVSVHGRRRPSRLILAFRRAICYSPLTTPPEGLQGKRPRTMSTTHEPAVELEQILSTADPAVFLVSPRLLCRIIKQHRQITGLGLQVPHRRCYVIDRTALMQIVAPRDIGLRDGGELPPTLILIAHPNGGRAIAL